MAENLEVTIAGLRAWARGACAEEAAVELLARAWGGWFASTDWPWVRSCEEEGWLWLDPEAIWPDSRVFSNSERRLLNVVSALLGGQPLVSLTGTLVGLDRQNLALVLAAFAHASGCRDLNVLIRTGDGAVVEFVGPFVDRPPAAIEGTVSR